MYEYHRLTENRFQNVIYKKNLNYIQLERIIIIQPTNQQNKMEIIYLFILKNELAYYIQITGIIFGLLALIKKIVET